jgi:hypothetical protein
VCNRTHQRRSHTTQSHKRTVHTQANTSLKLSSPIQTKQATKLSRMIAFAAQAPALQKLLVATFGDQHDVIVKLVGPCKLLSRHARTHKSKHSVGWGKPVLCVFLCAFRSLSPSLSLPLCVPSVFFSACCVSYSLSLSLSLSLSPV